MNESKETTSGQETWIERLDKLLKKEFPEITTGNRKGSFIYIPGEHIITGSKDEPSKQDKE